MATVTKRAWVYKGEKKTAFVLRYFDNEGKRRNKTFKLKRDALDAKHQVEIELRAGTHAADPMTITVRAVCELYLKQAEMRLDAGMIGQSRLKQIRQVIDGHLVPALGGLPIAKLTFLQVEGWHRGMLKGGLLPWTARAHCRELKLVEDFARKRKLTTLRIAEDVCAELRGIERKRIRTFGKEDMRRLIEAVDTPFPKQKRRPALMLRATVYLAAFCGLRYGEIFGLTRADLDLDRRILRVRHNLTQWDVLKAPKTRSGVRDVPLPAPVAAVLRLWLDHGYVPEPRKLLFRTAKGLIVKPADYHRCYWHPALTRAGLIRAGDKDPYHFHALRHFAASMMVHHNLPGPDVAKLLGHSHFDTTLQVYAHAMAEESQHREAFEGMAAQMMSPRTGAMRQIAA